MDPTVKYRSIFVYVLTSTEKTVRDRIWWVVLVGRYPSGRGLTQNSRGNNAEECRSRCLETMAPHESDNLEKNKKGGLSAVMRIEKVSNIGKHLNLLRKFRGKFVGFVMGRNIFVTTLKGDLPQSKHAHNRRFDQALDRTVPL